MPCRRHSAIALTLLIWLLLPGCATLKEPLVESLVPEAEARTLLEGWLEQSAVRQTVQGLAGIQVKTPQASLSGTQVLLAALPDRLRAETLSPFGTPVLSLACDGKRLTVVLPGDNLAYTGAATAENLSLFTRMPLPPAALVGILLWRPPLIDYEELTAFRIENRGWRLLLANGPLRQELFFDTQVRLLKVSYFSGDARQLTITYAGFTAEDSLPRQIGLEQPPYDLRGKVEFNDLTVNQPLPAERFSLQPPPASRIVPLDRSNAAGQLPADFQGE